MTQDTQPKLYDLSRRQVLGGLGAVGLASAGAGLGTSAFFRDDESVSAALTAGRLDLLIDYRATYNTWLGQAETDAIVNGTAIAAPGEEFNYVVGQAPDFRNGDGSMISGKAWADLTNSIDACTFENTTDIREEYEGFVDGTVDVEDGFVPGYVDGEDGLMFDLTDVKPKDEGEATISLHTCGNPAFIGLTASVLEASEGGVVEPEMNITNAAGDEFIDDDSASELANYIYVRVWRDDDCSNTYEDSELLLYQGSLAGLVAAVEGGDSDFVAGLQLPGDGDMGCFSPGVHCVAFDWYFICEAEDFELASDVPGAETIGDELDAAGLPRDPNVAQTDSVSFGLAFNAVQCRHNMPGITTETGEGFAKQEVFDAGTESSFARGRYGNNAPSGAFEVGIGEPDTPTPNFVDTANYVWTSGETVPFVYKSDGAGNASFTLDDVMVSGSVAGANGKLAITTKADEATIAVENVELDLDGSTASLSGPTAVTASNDGDGRQVTYLVINTTAADVSAPFELRGDVTVTLQGDYPGGDEDVAFDVSIE